MEEIGIIVAVIGATLKWMEDQKSEAARQEVSTQLQLLLDLMLKVLNELKNLRVVIREELEAAFRNDDIRQLSALKKSIQDAIAGIKDPNHIPPRIATQLETHFSDVKTLTYKLQQYGYAPYFAVVVGSLLSLQLAVLLRLPRAEILSIFDHIRKYFSDALLNDPRLEPETVRVTQEKTKAEEARLWDYAIRFPTKGYLGGFLWYGQAPTDPSFPPESGFDAYYLTLQGTIPADKSVGFRYVGAEPEEVDNENGNERHWASYPDILHTSDVIDSGDKLQNAKALVVGFISARLAERDDSWVRLGKLGSILMYNGEFLLRLDEFKKKIPKA